MFRLSCTLFFLCLFINTNAQIQLLNDEFDNSATLQTNWLNINQTEGWNAEHLEVHDINLSSIGDLYMMPYTSSWYQDYRGTLLYKNVNQDFVLTTEVTVSNRTDSGLPSSIFSLAGLMIRSEIDYPNGALIDWLPNNENYIFLAAGRATGSGPQFEVKNTVNGNSSLQISDIPTATNVQIRVARIASAVIVLYRLPNQNWEVHRRYSRPDFPSEIQIGFVTYTDWPKVSSYDEFFHNSHVLNSNLNPDPTSNVPFNPDIIGRFDFTRFDEVNVPVNLTGIDLVNSATDIELLSFLGYDSQVYCPTILQITDEIQSNQIAEISAQQDIEALNFINEFAEVNYTAGNSIELIDGFEVAVGAEFLANIGLCE